MGLAQRQERLIVYYDYCPCGGKIIIINKKKAQCENCDKKFIPLGFNDED